VSLDGCGGQCTIGAHVRGKGSSLPAKLAPWHEECGQVPRYGMGIADGGTRRTCWAALASPSFRSHSHTHPPTCTGCRRDTGIEMEERHERVVSSSLQALASLVGNLAQQRAAGALLATAAPPAETAALGGGGAHTPPKPLPVAALQQQQQQMEQGLVQAAALLAKPGFYKATFGSASAAIRAGVYR